MMPLLAEETKVLESVCAVCTAPVVVGVGVGEEEEEEEEEGGGGGGVEDGVVEGGTSSGQERRESFN